MFPQKRYHGAEFGREQSRTVAAKASRAEVLPTDHDSPAVNRLLARSALHVGHRARRNRTGRCRTEPFVSQCHEVTACGPFSLLYLAL